MNGLFVFLNGARGVAVCEALAAAGHPIETVFVPTAALGKEAVVAPLRALDFAVAGVDSVNDPAFVANLAERRPDILLVAGFSSIFRPPLLAVPRLGTLNLHAGRLPRYRGGSPLNWQIINGEAEAGLSVILMDSGIDTGPVLAAGEIPIGPHDTIADLHHKANATFPALVLAALERLNDGLPGDVQDEADAGYWHQRNDADGRLHWDRLGAQAAHDLVRGITTPYPGAFCFWNGAEVRILGTALTQGFPIRGVPGRIVYLHGEGPFVVCRDRAIRVTHYRVSGEPAIRLPHGAHLT